MKIKTTLVLILIATFFSACQKDWGSAWIGTYTGVAGNTNFNRVVVSQVDKKTVKLELQSLVLTNYVTFATVGSAKLSDANTATVNEDGTIAGFSGVYHFSGVAKLDGNTLTLNGQAQNKSNANDIQYYNFTGTR